MLLNRILQLANERKLRAHLIESQEDRPLPQLLLPVLRRLLLDLDRMASANAVAKRSLRGLAGFARGIKVKHGDFEVGLDIDPERGVTDSGDIENDLPELLVAVGEAARERKSAVVLLVDELQDIREVELSALIMGIHKSSKLQLPLLLIAAGLPQLVGNMSRSKSYSERLLDFPNVGPLARQDAILAIREPIAREGERIAGPAIDMILEASQGYPYFLQTWSYHAWIAAPRSPISRRDVQAVRTPVLKNLDEGFFRVRFDRLTPSEKRYLRAMAELGPGPHRSGKVAEAMGIKVSNAAPTRNSLIRKGMIYNPSFGDTAFTVPMLDELMKRQIPAL